MEATTNLQGVLTPISSNHSWKNSLSKYRHECHWLHLLSVHLILVVLPIYCSLKQVTSPLSLVSLFLICLVGFSQNIGLLHEHFHRFPKGNRFLSGVLVHLSYGIGGLNFFRGRTAHLLHHAHLGTILDPDRLGYLNTVGFWNRVKYLPLIGPLRSRFAPVDIESGALKKMSAPERKSFLRRCRNYKFFILFVHLTFLFCLKQWYLPWFLSLVVANILSNVREIAEHGNQGQGGLVNVKPSLLGVLLFNNPGFWYHGTHHWFSGIHYLELPLETEKRGLDEHPKIYQRPGYISYLINGI